MQLSHTSKRGLRAALLVLATALCALVTVPSTALADDSGPTGSVSAGFESNNNIGGLRLGYEHILQRITLTQIGAGIRASFGVGSTELDGIGATLPVDTSTFRLLPNFGVRTSASVFSLRGAVGMGIAHETVRTNLGDESSESAVTSLTLAGLIDADIRIVGPFHLGAELLLPIDMPINGSGDMHFGSWTVAVQGRLQF